MIVKDSYFPNDPKIALKNGLMEAEREFLRFAHEESIHGEV